MSPGHRFRGWLRRFRQQPVVLSSPFSVSECLQKLEAVTTGRSYISWHLSPANAGHPAPRFRGELRRDQVLIALFEDASGRNSYAAWLKARMEPAAAGGMTLTGSVGLKTEVRAVMPVIFGVWGLIGLATLVAGLIQAASGHFLALIPAVLVPLGETVILAGFNHVGLRSLEREIPRLLQAVNSVLEPTAVIPGQARPQNPT